MIKIKVYKVPKGNAATSTAQQNNDIYYAPKSQAPNRANDVLYDAYVAGDQSAVVFDTNMEVNGTLNGLSAEHINKLIALADVMYFDGNDNIMIPGANVDQS